MAHTTRWAPDPTLWGHETKTVSLSCLFCCPPAAASLASQALFCTAPVNTPWGPVNYNAMSRKNNNQVPSWLISTHRKKTLRFHRITFSKCQLKILINPREAQSLIQLLYLGTQKLRPSFCKPTKLDSRVLYWMIWHAPAHDGTKPIPHLADSPDFLDPIHNGTGAVGAVEADDSSSNLLQLPQCVRQGESLVRQPGHSGAQVNHCWQTWKTKVGTVKSAKHS